MRIAKGVPDGEAATWLESKSIAGHNQGLIGTLSLATSFKRSENKVKINTHGSPMWTGGGSNPLRACSRSAWRLRP